MRQKQAKTSLTESEFAKLEASALERGASLSDEIRWRVLWSMREEAKQDERPDIANLHSEIDLLIRLVEDACGCRWDHPPAGRALLRAIKARFERKGIRDDAVFAPDERPADRLVVSDNPDTIGIAVEAFASQKRGFLGIPKREDDE